MGDMSTLELWFFIIMGILFILLALSVLVFLMRSDKFSVGNKKTSPNEQEILKRVKDIEEKVEGLTQSLESVEDYFSSMMYQLDELSKNNKHDFQKISDYLMFLQQMSKTEKPKQNEFYDIMKIDEHKAEYKEQFQRDEEKENILSTNDLTEMLKRSRQIERAEMRTADVGEMAKELNMSRGEIELVKQLNQIKEGVKR